MNQLSKKHGTYAASKANNFPTKGAQNFILRHGMLHLFLFFFAIALPTGLFLFFEPTLGPLEGERLVAIFAGGLLCVALLWKAASLRLWEYWFGAVCVLGIPLLVWVVPDARMLIKWFVPLAAMQLVIGKSFQKRWAKIWISPSRTAYEEKLEHEQG